MRILQRCDMMQKIEYRKAFGAVLPWVVRIIGKQVKGLYDLVTVCNERAV